MLAKAYYSLFLPEHFVSWCYYCHLKHMILRTIIDREDNCRYFYSEFKLDEFEEKGSPYLFYDEWLKKKTQLVKTQCNPVNIFILQKLYMINIICSNKFIIFLFIKKIYASSWFFLTLIVLQKCLFKISSSIILSFLLFEIQFEYSIESFLETKLGNSPIIAFISLRKFTFNLKFNIALSRGVSLIFSDDYMM